MMSLMMSQMTSMGRLTGWVTSSLMSSGRTIGSKSGRIRPGSHAWHVQAWELGRNWVDYDRVARPRWKNMQILLNSDAQNDVVSLMYKTFLFLFLFLAFLSLSSFWSLSLLFFRAVVWVHTNPESDIDRRPSVRVRWSSTKIPQKVHQSSKKTFSPSKLEFELCFDEI